MTYSSALRSSLFLAAFAFILPTKAQWQANDPGFTSNRSLTAKGQELYVASYLNGIKCSIDNGQTWTDRNNGLPTTNGNLFVETVGNDGTWLFAGLHTGIYRSNDGGLNWVEANGSIQHSSYNHVETFLSFGNTTLAVMSEDPLNGGGIFRTDDHGETWLLSSIGMLACGKVYDLIMDNGVLYASCSNGFFTSSDLGLNWSQTGGFSHIHSYCISPLQANSRVAGDQFNIKFSLDGGQNWQTADGPSNYDDVQIRFFDGLFIAVVEGNDKGVWQSTNGADWVKMNGIDQLDELVLNDTYQFGNTLFLGAIMNIYSVESGSVSLAPKMILGAAYDTATQLMRDDLRSMGLIPLQEPYSDLGFEQAGNGGSENMLAHVLENTGNNAIVDWVLVELRDANEPRTILETKSALLQRDGDVVNTTGDGPLRFELQTDEYFVSVRHRGHLGVMTMAPIQLSSLPKPLDFSSGSLHIHGTNARMDIPGIKVLWPGDAQHDGIVLTAGEDNDRDAILERIGGTSISAMIGGYHCEDINLDGTINYEGPNNDRDVLMNTIGNIQTAVIVEQLP